MTQPSRIVSAFSQQSTELLREPLLTRTALSINGFYLPAGQKVSFQPTPGVDRLHLLLRGRCKLVQGGTEITLEEGRALGVGAPGAHQLEALERGVALFTLALKGPEGPETSGGLTILDVLGPGRLTARARLSEWSSRPSVGGRLAVLPLETLPPGPVQVFAASERLLLVLEGQARLEVPGSELVLRAPCLHLLPPDTPHRLLPASERVTVMALSDPEPADAILSHLACGHRARWCDLVRLAGDGLLLLDALGTVLEVNAPAARALGLPDVSWRGLLPGRLLARDAQWLEQQLSGVLRGEPARTVWASPGVKDQILSVLLVPWQGAERLERALVYVRPLTDAGLMGRAEGTSGGTLEGGASRGGTWGGLTAAGAAGLASGGSSLELGGFLATSPRMAGVLAQLESLARAQSHVVVWGEAGTGRSTVARLLHALGSEPLAPFRSLDCQRQGEAGVAMALFGEEGLGGEGLGPWLRGLGQGTLFLERFYALPAAYQRKILKALAARGVTSPTSGAAAEGEEPWPAGALVQAGRDLEGAAEPAETGEALAGKGPVGGVVPPAKPMPGSFLGRVVVELDRRPAKTLPGVSVGEKLPRRGAFFTLELPPLRERPEDVPLLLRHFLNQALPAGMPVPTFSAEALEGLLQHALPGNLHLLARLASVLAASPPSGAVTGATLKALLGKRPLEAIFGEEDAVPTLVQAERELLVRALKRSGGNRSQAARLLGIPRPRLYRLLLEHQLED